MTMLENSRTAENNKTMVSKILVRYATDGIPGHPRLTQQAIADMIGNDNEGVKEALFSLEDEGLIRLEHLRIVVNRKLLEKVGEF